MVYDSVLIRCICLCSHPDRMGSDSKQTSLPPSANVVLIPSGEEMQPVEPDPKPVVNGDGFFMQPYFI